MLRVLICCLTVLSMTPTQASELCENEQEFYKTLILLHLDVYETTQMQATCKALLDTTKDPQIRSTAVRLITMPYPWRPHNSIELLHVLLRKGALGSLEQAKKIEALFAEKKSSLGDYPSLSALSTLIDSANPQKAARLEEDRASYEAGIARYLCQDAELALLKEDSPADQACLVLHNHLLRGYRYLRDAERAQRIDDFINFGNCMPDTMTPQSYMALWGVLAKSYLNIAVDAFVDHQQYKICSTYFIPELSDFMRREATTYEWFMFFCERLTILMTDPHDLLVDLELNRRGDDFNVKIGQYFCALYTQTYEGKPAWYTHDGFLHAVENAGSYYTQQLYSLKALCANFPADISLPWAGDLGLVDILRTTPRPSKNRVWLLGFLPGRNIADGNLLTSGKFWGHDKFHKANFNAILMSVSYLNATCKHFIAPTIEELWSYLREGRRLFYDSLSAVLSFINQPEDKDQRQMNAFFAFYVFHEGTNTLEDRLFSLTDADIAMYTRPGIYGHLRDKDMYRPHLTKRLQKADQVAFQAQYLAFAKKFVALFSENKTLVREIQNWLNSSSAIFKNPGNLSVADQNRNLSFYDAKEGFLKKTFTEFQEAMTGICESTMITRTYFLGPITNVGEEVPKTLVQRWKFDGKK